MRFLLCFVLMLMFSGSALAFHPDERLDDPTLETRARIISKQLRCLQCQNQTIDDSDAQIAIDLRRLVRKKILQGQSDQAIIDYVHEHYGDFVLMSPPVKPATYGLWFLPFLVFALGGCAAVIYLRQQSARFKTGDDT